ncbi:hypothetical protein BVC71_06580 [Marivivens niveibacter]|uniref:Pyruvate/2-oxoglutarate dehydrogenase complex, dihydrolipoamide acyltransferase (E2) component n=1 Tax=Marivivens niveibacter TaxID=1930667 RepID=A0A251WYX9_9RHOB|nr:DUF3035 domain-containing protein [Marivivens niveibacter]OUD09511.1 hypothetical protein BVC71_06580 [Marivivens niveibacter]
MRGFFIALPAVLALVACSGGERTLHNSRALGDSPDEFRVSPSKTLEIPDSMAFLPAPTPGGVNRADATPLVDAIAALGGTYGAGVTGDAALMAEVSRYGYDPEVRAELAEADADFRRRKTGLSWFRIFRNDRYFAAYRGQALDAYAELERFRSVGVAVPSAPPAN